MEGNQQKMREALVKIHDLTNALDEKCGVDPVEIRDIARAALSAPARQCDVGTPEEQWSRFEKMCFSNRQPDDPDYCSCKCKVDGGCVNDCALIWAQMPYEEGGAS